MILDLCNFNKRESTTTSFCSSKPMILHHSMERIPIWVFLISFILLLQTASSTDEEQKQALLVFFQKLSNGMRPNASDFVGWNDSTDPCSNAWQGIRCDKGLMVHKVTLEGLGLGGVLDVDSICELPRLAVLSIANNNLHGEISENIANCKQLTHLYMSNNQFSGGVPASIAGLNNLKRLDLSNNDFTEELPDFTKISGLNSFFGQSNQLTGRIAGFNFANLLDFNISFNQFSGPIPEPASRFDMSSFIGNPGLCGKPLPKACSPSAS